MQRALIVILLLTTAPLVGCFHEYFSGPAPAVVVEGWGAVVYVDLEGGFYGLETTTSEKYLPLNLSRAFRKDGMKVHFKARLVEDAITLHQWGTPVELVFIERTY